MSKTKPVATLQFVHDRENGWYELTAPDGTYEGAWNYATNAKNYCESNGWDIKYVGEAYYDPFC